VFFFKEIASEIIEKPKKEIEKQKNQEKWKEVTCVVDEKM
jgi:hypothetical protein